MKIKEPEIYQVKIEKLVHGGQGIGILEDGKTAFVWNALPGEVVRFEVTKKKKNWCEGIATEILEKSSDRIIPAEPEIYLSTSPWQILNYLKEADYKQEILNETFVREGLNINFSDFVQQKNEQGYRNKMEYNFWFDNDTNLVSLALHKRGSHQKLSVKGSILATENINRAGLELIEFINKNKIEARPLKSVIIRSDTTGTVGVSLFVNDKKVKKLFSQINIKNSIFEILYSNPKSPASVATEILLKPERNLTDSILGKDFYYTSRSFFQVNVPIYETVLQIIKESIKSSKIENILELYSGVGSIGLSVVDENKVITMVEISEESTAQAKLNLNGRDNCIILTSSAESALDYIQQNQILILDPPRAGLHAKVRDKIIENMPKQIIYLSCNPSTQARDIKELIDIGYSVDFAQGFNFFPRTPHIESLIMLSKLQ